jgi:hypothetical protein
MVAELPKLMTETRKYGFLPPPDQSLISSIIPLIAAFRDRILVPFIEMESSRINTACQGEKLVIRSAGM